MCEERYELKGAMTVKLFITIDTEEDSWDNFNSLKNPVENIKYLVDLQKLFDRYGAIPTYLINYPVASNKDACRIFQNILAKGSCEIGTHCHPWNTPPFEEEVNNHNSWMCNLSYGLLKKKMEILHETIVNSYHVTPLCFRAGRYAFDTNVARVISTLGYQIDTSLTPFIDWSGSGGRDFSESSTYAYRFYPENIFIEQIEGNLVEIPITIGFLQNNMRLCSSLRKRILGSYLSRLHLLGVFEKMGIMNFRWLSPEVSSGADMIRLAERFIQKGHRYLTMSFHSTSLLPGKSPFVRDKQQLEIFLNRIERFLNFASEQNLIFAPLSDAIECEP